MEYRGPAASDLANVYGLNHAFLEWLRLSDRDPGLPPGTGTLLRALDQRQVDRLARMPFLLLSLRENDDALWNPVFAQKSGPGLLRRMHDADEDGVQLTAATLGFLWQLAACNPYTVRFVSGASLAWCERLAACTLIDVVRRVAEEPLILEPRMNGNLDLWRKLLTSGISAKRDVRLAARVSGLHAVLTGATGTKHRQFASAACKLPRARIRAADPPGQ